MVLDYSKWDRIELSDDSDIEVHPNVDKRSFINAKRRQIHEQRHQRKQQIQHLRTEISINGYLLKRLDKLVSTLENTSGQSPDEIVLQAIVDITSEDKDDPAPEVPQGAPSYAQMMATLVDTIKQEIDTEKPADRWRGFVDKLKFHQEKLAGLRAESSTRLADLEKEDSAKITSDSIHEGFSASHVNKSPSASASTSTETKKKTVVQKVQAVEQLNPGVKAPGPGHESFSSGAEADMEVDDDDDTHIEPTKLGREFAKIKIGNYKQCFEFISQNMSVLAERETDGLLIDAFNSQIAGKSDFAKQCVHQALLLQYCRQLGRDGVVLFFKRITTPNHQAQKVFHDDVNTTYNRIRDRAKELAAERAKEDAGVEQIQLHAVDPNTTINIAIPPPDSEDPEVQNSRKLFEAFPPGLQRALESGSLDEVNKVLGKMSVEEAEEVVQQLGEGGMLSLESQIIDATTEEGKKQLEELEKEEEAAKKDANEKGKGKAMEVVEEGAEEKFVEGVD
ncbi:hsp90 co-chaperone Cdc37 [Rhizina undulata]